MATQNVSIVFRTIGGNQLNSQLRNLTQNTGMFSRGLARMQGHLGSVVGGFGMLRIAASAVLGGVLINEIVSVGDEFERTTIQMAGFLQAMHLAPSYVAGLTEASEVMRKIRRDAAVLPGEAEDYARVFTVALPEVSQAIGGSIDEMMKFTNKATAIGTVFGIDSFQLAHDLQRMMYAGRGSAGFHVRLFNQLMPFMRNVKGYANLNTKSFNEMGQAARGKLIQQAMAQLDDMIEASKDSFDAMRGAASEAFKSIMRFGGMPIFVQAKKIMAGFAAALLDAQGNLTQFGQVFSYYGQIIGDTIGKAVAWVGGKFSEFTDNGTASMDTMITKIEVFTDRVIVMAKELGTALLTMKAMSVAGGFALSGGGTFAKQKGLNSAVSLGPIQQLGMLIAGKAIAPPMAGPMTRVAASEAAGAAAISTGALTAGIMALTAALIVGGAIAFSFIENFAPIVKVFATLGALFLPHIGKAFENLWRAAKPFLNLWGSSMMYVMIGVIGIVGGALTGLAMAFNKLMDVIGPMFDWLNEKISSVMWGPKGNPPPKTAEYRGPVTGLYNTQSWYGQGQSMMPRASGYNLHPHMTRWNAQSMPTAAIPSVEPPDKRPGTTVNQDFRNSRFNIDQKFAEGFDPDRVAIAFANDLAKVGDRRTNSQFASIFAR